MKIQRHKLLNSSILMIFIFLVVLGINLSIGYTEDSNPSASKMFHTVADGPNFIISEDFNRDGKKDFAMANRDSDNILILFKNSDGAFNWDWGRFYEVGDSPECIISDDFNKDGNSDLAVANSGSNNVMIFINNGDGSFLLTDSEIVNDSPESMVSADFDGDGYSDLAVANSASNNVSILINEKDGIFSNTFNTLKLGLATGNSPKSITSAYFDSDGYIDLAVADDDSDNIFIIPGKGDGTFSRAVSYKVGDSPKCIISDDFNKDGNSDLAVANSGFDNNVTILINNGEGAFIDKGEKDVGIGPESMVSADFDGDGYSDLAVVNSVSDNVSILINNGDDTGTFQDDANNVYAVGDSPESIISYDLNGDEYLDLVVANSVSDNVSILINNGDGTGTFHVDSNYVYAVGGIPESLISDDFDNDGYNDLAVVNSGSNTLTILVGNGKEGIFSEILFYLDLLGEDPTSVISDDFNKDDNADLAIANSGSDNVTILIGEGNRSFIQHDLIDDVGDSPVSIISARFNNDEYLDLGVVNSENAKIILGDANDTFSRDFLDCATGDEPISIISYNFYGDPNSVSDLAVANRKSDSVFVWLNNEEDTIFDAAGNYDLGESPEAIISADFNQDGKPDLASANSGSGDVTILYGYWDGSFSEPVSYKVVDGLEGEEENRKIEPRSIISEDFNNDGYLDLAVASSINNTVSDYVTIFFGNGNGVFSSGINIEIGDSPKSLISANFISEGKADLAVVNSNGITIFLNSMLSSLRIIKDQDGPIPPPSDSKSEDLGGGICFISSISIKLR